jgi:hypothetical protein
MSLMELLPPVYESNITMQELQGILTTDINEMASSLNETIDECSVSTASTLLSRYEKLYGLHVDVSKSDTFRRERIMAKLRGIGTTTKMMIIDTAAAYSNGSVEVIEDVENQRFRIKFVGTRGIPANMADLTLTIEEIKPAHLNYTFEYVYNINGALRGFTNAHLSNYTHYQLRNEVLT